MSADRPSVVLDCNVLLQAVARAHGPAGQCLRLVERNLITVYLSKPILREVRAVLYDAALRAANLALTSDRVDAFLSKLAYRCEVVRDVRRTVEFSRDPKDQPYIDLALTTGADYLVSRDGDLLDLATGHDEAAKAIRQRSPQLRVVSPPDFLADLKRRWPSEFADL
jgi:putative PIN family toxin of toxin-antitoxin system